MKLDPIQPAHTGIEIFGNIVCIKCGKNCGNYTQSARYRDTQTFICMRCLRRKVTCPSCGDRPAKLAKDYEESTSKQYVYNCTCLCKREYDVFLSVEFIDSLDDLKLIKKVKRSKPQQEGKK